MRKIIRLCSLLALPALLFVSSCSKKDPGPSKEQMLTSKGWKLTQATLSAQGHGTQDAPIPSCEFDNITYFRSSGTYSVDEGASKCDPADPQTVDTGTWRFNNDKTIITTTSSDPNSSTPINLTVTSITSTTLILKMNIDIGGVTFVGTFTYTAQ